jgi:hypothetical protein
MSVLLKESISLFLLFQFTILLVDLAKDVLEIMQSFKRMESYMEKSADEILSDIIREPDQKKLNFETTNLILRFLMSLAQTITRYLISQTNFYMTGLIFLCGFAAYYSINQEFTIITPVYCLLSLIIWCTFFNIVNTLPKNKSIIYFRNKAKKPVEVIILEENYSNKYLIVINKMNEIKKMYLHDLSEIEIENSTKAPLPPQPSN